MATSSIRRYEVVRRPYEDATNALLDNAESHLIDGVKAGAWNAVTYDLNSKGRPCVYGAARLSDAVERELMEMLRRLKVQLFDAVYVQVVTALAAG